MKSYDSPTSSTPAETGSDDAPENTGMLGEAKNKIAQTARETAAKVKTAASDTAERVKEKAESVATEKKETAADRIGSYSSAIHESARSLEEKDPNIAWFTHRAADRLQVFADYVRDRDFSQLRRDAEDVARRHPAAFFGGMFLAGLVLGNVVKASRRKLDSAEGFENESADESDRGRRTIEPETAPDLTEAERSATGI